MKKSILLFLVVFLGGSQLSANAQTIESTKRSGSTTETELYVTLGGGRILNSIDDNGYSDEELYDELRNGFEWSIGMRRYYNQMGWGIQFQHYTATCEDNRYGSVTIDQTVDVFYLAPQFNISTDRSKKWIRYLSAGCGWLMYQEGSSASGISIKGRAHTLGSNLTGGIEYRFSQRIGVAVETSLIGGVFSKLKYNDDEVQNLYDDYITDKEFGVSRLTLSVSLHIHL